MTIQTDWRQCCSQVPVSVSRRSNPADMSSRCRASSIYSARLRTFSYAFVKCYRAPSDADRSCSAPLRSFQLPRLPDFTTLSQRAEKTARSSYAELYRRWTYSGSRKYSNAFESNVLTVDKPSHQPSRPVIDFTKVFVFTRVNTAPVSKFFRYSKFFARLLIPYFSRTRGWNYAFSFPEVRNEERLSDTKSNVTIFPPPPCTALHVHF